MSKLVYVVVFAMLLAGCGGGGGSSGGADIDPPGNGGGDDGGSGGGGGDDGGGGTTNTAPVITLVGSSVVEIMEGDSYQDQGATATDAEDGNLTNQIQVSGANFDTNVPGRYTITYRVTDSGGAGASATRDVVVIGDAAPTISLLGDNPVVVPVDSVFNDPGATAEDAEDGTLTDQIQSSSNVDTTIIGTYTINYSVTDSGGKSAAASREVRVTDPGMAASSVVARLRSLTRVSGVSPETVYFSAQDSTDENCVDFSDGNDATACATGQWLAYHFDFDDPDSGNFATTGLSRNKQVGPSPRAIHTFTCTPESSRYQNGTCVYNVGVRAMNPDGEFSDAFLEITIQAQETAYDLADTICVSPAGNFDGCPAGAEQRQQTPDVGGYSGKRILLHAGERHSNICIGYGEKNVTVDTYGVGTRPLVPDVRVGVDTGCGDTAPNTSRARGYDMLAKDGAGHITQGWAYDITVTGIRAGFVGTGMSSTLVTAHDLDIDWSNDSEFPGGFAFISAGSYCTNTPEELDCDVVPSPYGVFFTDSVVKANGNNLPNINIGCMNDCLMINGGMAGIEAKHAIEHNARFMGVWGFVASNLRLRGDHVGGRGGKHRITLRQTSDTDNVRTDKDAEDFAAGNHIRTRDISEHWSPTFNFIFDSIFNDTEMLPAHESAAFVDIRGGHFYTGVFNNEFLLDEVDQSASQLSLGGINVVEQGNVFNPVNRECRIVSGVIEGPYLDTNKIFTSIPGCGQLAPRELVVPLAPAR